MSRKGDRQLKILERCDAASRKLRIEQRIAEIDSQIRRLNAERTALMVEMVEEAQ